MFSYSATPLRQTRRYSRKICSLIRCSRARRSAATLLTALIELFSARRELQRIGAVAGGTGDA